MIKVKINHEGDFIKDFKIEGHSNYNNYGKDIVCASVSSIVITSINMALRMDKNIINATDKPGFISVEVLKYNEVINNVFNNMIDMLKELEKNYSKNIKINIE